MIPDFFCGKVRARLNFRCHWMVPLNPYLPLVCRSNKLTSNMLTSSLIFPRIGSHLMTKIGNWMIPGRSNIPSPQHTPDLKNPTMDCVKSTTQERGTWKAASHKVGWGFAMGIRNKNDFHALDIQGAYLLRFGVQGILLGVQMPNLRKVALDV